MAYFEAGSEAMIELEAMVDKVGLANVLWALSSICAAKAEHVAHDWQDTKLGKIWESDARKVARAAREVKDPLAA